MKRLTTVRIWLSMMKIRGKTLQSSESVLFDPLIHVLAPIDIVLMHMTHVYSRDAVAVHVLAIWIDFSPLLYKTSRSIYFFLQNALTHDTTVNEWGLSLSMRFRFKMCNSDLIGNGLDLIVLYKFS